MALYTSDRLMAICTLSLQFRNQGPAVSDLGLGDLNLHSV